MITAARIKQIRSLTQKKFRKELSLFVVEGEKAVSELLLHKNWEINHIYALESWLIENTIPGNIPSDRVSEKELSRISSLTTPNSVLALVNIPVWNINDINPSGDITLMLDNIQDPGNLGTIIRTADWFGIDNIICSENTVEVFNPKVIQASMGSFMRVKVFYTSLKKYLENLPEPLPVMGAMLDGEDLYKTGLPGRGFLITGNESQGISPELVKLINRKIRIPLFHKAGKTQQPESLNAGIATGIILSHLRNYVS
ncbi:MAG: RNA methyltransferase [Bacteroidales bacterium]|nr:RNA methyltransferase [Bacteroidales bacterium]